MGLLDVNTAGLQALAGKCSGWAAELTAEAPSSSPAASCQASAAAVSAVHAEVGLAGQTLVGRMHSTAARLTEAGGQYRATEAESSTNLAALTTEL